MKKIILSLVVASQFVFGASDKPKDYTVEEMLKKVYSNSEELEGFDKDTDFKYMYKYLADFDEKEQEMMNKVFLFYLHKLNSQHEKYTELTDQMLSSLEEMKTVRSKGKFITLQNKENTNTKILNNITYYVDFKNEKIYSNEMKNFVQTDFNELFSILYQFEYNRVLIFEPKNTKTAYFSIIDLGKLTTFSFKDLKETVDIYMERKAQQDQKKGK